MASNRPTLDEVLQIPDPMLSDNFELFFDKIPGDGVTGSAAAMRIQCKTATKPGMTVEQVALELFGHTVEFAGRLTFTHTMSVEYVENWKGTITRTLEKWIELSRSHKTQSGNFKKDYTANATLNIFNQAGNISLSYQLTNIFPTNTGELAFDGASATALSVSAEFSFDSYELLSENTI